MRHANLRAYSSGLALVLLLGATSPAQDIALTDPERDKVTVAIKMMYFIFGDPDLAAVPAIDGNLLPKSLSDLFGTDTNDVAYETGTLRDMIFSLFTLNNSGKIVKNPDVKGAAVKPSPGTTADLIKITPDAFTLACNPDPLEKVWGKIVLGGLLSNEATHVFQEFEGDDQKQCDAEVDSFILECEYLERIERHLTGAGSNARLEACLTGLSAAQRTELLGRVQIRKGVAADWVELLTDLLPMSWGKAYYGPDWSGKPISFPKKNPTTRGDTTLKRNDGMPDPVFPVSPLELIIQSTVYKSEQDDTILTTVTVDAMGNRMLHFWRDADDDGLPEPTEATPPVPIPGPPSIDPGLNGVGIYPVLPPELDFTGAGRGLLIHDFSNGRVVSLEVGANGLPTQSPVFLFQDPAIADNGGFIYFHGVKHTNPGAPRLVFSNQPLKAQFPHVDSVWFDLVGATPMSPGVVNPQTASVPFAQAVSPCAPPGIEGLRVGGSIRLHGNPGEFLRLFSIGDGLPAMIASGIAGGDGATTLLNPSPAITGNNLYRILSPTGVQELFLSASDSLSVGTAVLDEDGDMVPDRVDLTMNPPRLHLSLGIFGGGAVQHVYELVVHAEPDPVTLGNWVTGSRAIVTVGGDLPCIIVPRIGNTPIYAVPPVDLNGDAVPNETVAIERPSGTSQFRALVYDSVQSPNPNLTQVIPLPIGHEPGGMVIRDPDVDNDLDVCILGHGASVSLTLRNNGIGFFVLENAAAYPGSGEDLRVGINVIGRVALCGGIHPAAPGDTALLSLRSPQGTFLPFPALLVAQLFLTGSPPLSPFGFPEIHINPTAVPIPVVIYDGTQGLFGPQSLPPQGISVRLNVPPGLAGTSAMFQGFSFAGALALNSIFAVTDGEELRFIP